ncbi:hypothetical protein [uncultured Clostridium sp.]|jgi:hypothetical protein|uniref:hypothetical protein n=1 Tax=uncultured Clostridium sp. TaxID=59620 RepID=UPI002625F69B|nr:hypothetical protein [uncultured Clostridium sp.]
MKKSIYGIILENTNDDIVDKDKVSDIINPTIDGNIKISAGFLDKFALDISTKKEHTEKILKVVNKIFNGEFNLSQAEEALKEINFKTLNIMDTLIPKLNNENYSMEVYSLFKELIYKTKNIEICKFALEMTGISGLCEELIDDYLLFGQVENFTNSISFIMRVWRKNEKFADAFFKLLDDSEGWGAVNYTLGIMSVEEFFCDIENHKKILISALNKNPITIEICSSIAKDLNIKELLNYEKMDKELAFYINELFRSLLHEIEPCGGIYAVKDYKSYLTDYIKFLKEMKYDDIKFIGVKNLNFFLVEDLESLIASANRCSVGGKLQIIADEIKAIWKELNTMSNFEDVLVSGNEYLYELIDHAIKNETSDEVSVYFENMYKYDDISGACMYYLEKFLVLKGSKEIKEKIYKDLEELYDERLKVELFNDEIGIEKILSKTRIIPLMIEKDSIELLKKILNDFNPKIRAEGLKLVGELWVNNQECLDDELKNIIKLKIDDKVEYVASDAKKICDKSDIEYDAGSLNVNKYTVEDF